MLVLQHTLLRNIVFIHRSIKTRIETQSEVQEPYSWISFYT